MRLVTNYWRALPAGRELDALVAEYVLRWRGVQEMAASLNGGRNLFAIRPEHGAARSGERTIIVPRFSASIGAAWGVVPVFQAHDVSLMLEQVRYEEHDVVDDAWHAERGEWLAHFQNTCTVGTGVGTTAPLAICRAALEAVPALP